MDKKEWDKLERVVQDQLASKYGITRSGENNEIVTAEALANIPETKKEKEEEEEEKKVTPKEDEPKKKTREVSAKKHSKRSNRRKSTK